MATGNSVTFGWPSKDLSPNARCHWSKKARAARQYKLDCWYLARESEVKATWPGAIHLHIEFHKPSRRAMDLDNMLASIKSGLDGLALALNVDDSRFALHLSVAETIGGMVKIRVGEA